MPHKDLVERNACQKRCHDADPNRPAKVREYGRKMYQSKADLIKEAKSKPCMDCGKTFPPCCMDFDHRPGTIKKFTIGEWGYKGNSKSIEEEIAKCDVVCANCHRIRTYILRRRDSS